MNKIVYYSLLVYLYILFFMSIILIPYSLVKLKKRKNRFVYILRFFLYFGYYCTGNFYFMFIDAIHIEGMNYNSNNMVYLMITIFVAATIGVFLLWIWIHYEIEILDDKIIFRKLFFGKEIICFDQIDVENSRYQFIHPKRKKDFGHEVLKLKMKNGKQYSIILDELVQDGNNILLTEVILIKLKIKRENIYK